MAGRLKNFRFSPGEERLLTRLRRKWNLKSETKTVKVALLACLDRDLDAGPYLEELDALRKKETK